MTEIRLELFPAAVTSDAIGGTRDNTKVYVTNDTMYVYVDSNGPDAGEILYEVPVFDFLGSPLESWKVEDENHTTWNIQRGGCGCGSRLRGFLPFQNVPYAKNYGLGSDQPAL